LPPNPNTRRAFRASWDINNQQTHITYPVQNNVVIRDVKNPQNSVVYTDFMNKVTSVSYSPNGAYIASGDDKGKVKIWSYSEESKEFVVKKEHGMLGGAVQAISFTDDG